MRARPDGVRIRTGLAVVCEAVNTKITRPGPVQWCRDRSRRQSARPRCLACSYGQIACMRLNCVVAWAVLVVQPGMLPQQQTANTP